jgi:hypothetical protein
LIPYKRYLEVLALLESKATLLGSKKSETRELRTLTAMTVFRIGFKNAILRISIVEAYHERSLEPPAPVIFLEDENNPRWFAKISFEAMNDRQVHICLDFFIAQFKKLHQL